MAVPRVIKILSSCIRHNIQDSLIARLHYNDLCLLIMTFDIANMKEMLRHKEQERLSKNNVGEVRQLSDSEAIAFLSH